MINYLSCISLFQAIFSSMLNTLISKMQSNREISQSPLELPKALRSVTDGEQETCRVKIFHSGPAISTTSEVKADFAPWWNPCIGKFKNVFGTTGHDNITIPVPYQTKNCSGTMSESKRFAIPCSWLARKLPHGTMLEVSQSVLGHPLEEYFIMLPQHR